MQFFARLMMIAVVATVAVSSVAHAVGSARMASEMIAAGFEMTGLADCEACDEDAAGTLGFACDFVCNSAAAALVEALADYGPFAVSGAHGLPAAQDFRGLNGPPAKQPPRTLF